MSWWTQRSTVNVSCAAFSSPVQLFHICGWKESFSSRRSIIRHFEAHNLIFWISILYYQQSYFYTSHDKGAIQSIQYSWSYDRQDNVPCKRQLHMSTGQSVAWLVCWSVQHEFQCIQKVIKLLQMLLEAYINVSTLWKEKPPPPPKKNKNLSQKKKCSRNVWNCEKCCWIYLKILILKSVWCIGECHGLLVLKVIVIVSGLQIIQVGNVIKDIARRYM